MSTKTLEQLTLDEGNFVDSKRVKVEAKLLGSPEIVSVYAGSIWGSSHLNASHDRVKKAIQERAPEDANAYFVSRGTKPLRSAKYEEYNGYCQFAVLYLQMESKTD